MAKQKKHRKHPVHRNLSTYCRRQYPEEECADIPYSYVDLPLTAEAFSVGLYLYYSRQSISDHFPGAQGIASVLKMDLDLAVHCLKELEDNGVMQMYEDGTFTMNDNPGHKTAEPQK